MEKSHMSNKVKFSMWEDTVALHSMSSLTLNNTDVIVKFNE